MSENAATHRLQKEYRALAKEFEEQIRSNPGGQISDNFIAAPETKNIYVWHFVIFGLPDKPYQGGYYMGKLKFPTDYPWKPPSILMTTESGRFEVNKRICLSISDYHPETWNPIWPVRSIIIGLISFFVTELNTVGSIKNKSNAEREKIAKESKKLILKNQVFLDLFSTMKDNIGLQTAKQVEPVQTQPAKREEADKIDTLDWDYLRSLGLDPQEMGINPKDIGITEKDKPKEELNLIKDTRLSMEGDSATTYLRTNEDKNQSFRGLVEANKQINHQEDQPQIDLKTGKQPKQLKEQKAFLTTRQEKTKKQNKVKCLLFTGFVALIILALIWFISVLFQK